MKKYLLFFICSLLFSSAAALTQSHKYTLVIDAGHGGSDPGTVCKPLREKDINLTIALAFGKLVEQNCSDVKVIYTRKTDVFIPLYQRASIANKNKADVFISIHTNSSKKYAAGFETYTMGVRRSNEKLSAAMRENEVVLQESDYEKHYAGFDPRSPESYIIFDLLNETNMAESVELAQMIQRHVCAGGKRPNRGVRQDAFLVLRETSMPACLVEVGFINHEQKVLSNNSKLNAMARDIYEAFVEYKNKQTGGKNTKKEEKQEQQTKEDEEKSAKKEEQQPARKEEPVAQKEGSTAAKKKPADKQDAADAAKDTESAAQSSADADPVFKVQFLAVNKKLNAGDRQFKGITDYDCYQENGLWKYTVGASADYNAIVKLRNEVQKKFPQAFIIAFKNGEKVDKDAAYQEYKTKKNKKK